MKHHEEGYPVSRALGLKVIKSYSILHPVLNIYESWRLLEKECSRKNQKHLQHPKEAKQTLYKA